MVVDLDSDAKVVVVKRVVVMVLPPRATAAAAAAAAAGIAATLATAPKRAKMLERRTIFSNTLVMKTAKKSRLGKTDRTSRRRTASTCLLAQDIYGFQGRQASPCFTTPSTLDTIRLVFHTLESKIRVAEAGSTGPYNLPDPIRGSCARGATRSLRIPRAEFTFGAVSTAESSGLGYLCSAPVAALPY